MPSNGNLVLDTSNRGKWAKVLCYGGKIVERIIWEETDDAVFVCTQEKYKKLLGDNENECAHPPYIGFPKRDVTLMKDTAPYV